MSQETATRFKAGDVIRYVPDGGWHARQGTAIVNEHGKAVDTFWGDGSGHVLREKELAGAEVVFNLGDYRKLGEHFERRQDEWLKYAPEDRQRIGSQSQYQSTYYVRVGAEPSLDTQIENARVAVQDAESAVRSAQQTVEWRKEDLAKLEAERNG